MSSHLPISERRAQAKREIGSTVISPVCKLVSLAALILLLLLTTLGQFFADPGVLGELAELPRAAQRGWQEGAEKNENRLFSANRTLLAAMNRWEDEMEDTAWFHDPLLKSGQPLLWRLGAGNGQAVPGRGDWLHFQPDIDYLIQGAFDLEAVMSGVIDFRDQLQEQGIELLIVPAPSKPQIYPESLTDRELPIPLRNPAEEALLVRLAQEEIPVIDLAASLSHFARKDGQAYLKTDTHWTPEAMQHAAGETAQRLFDLGWVSLPQDPVPAIWEETEIVHLGDIAEMLALPENQTLIAPERITHQRVLLESDDPPQVLLLGDSFSNIFSLEAMGWGAQGGFAEHLQANLRQPVQALVRNDAGASASRGMLSRDLARGNDRLEGIEVVVWQFAARELSFGDWQTIPMFSHRSKTETVRPEEAADPSKVQQGGLLDGSEHLTVLATVEAVSPIPRPGQVAYADHVATVHLTNIESEDGRYVQQEAVARFQSMRNHTLLETARWRRGMTLHLQLVPFSEVEDEYGALNTSELDDFDLMLATPFWIKEVLP